MWEEISATLMTSDRGYTGEAEMQLSPNPVGELDMLGGGGAGLGRNLSYPDDRGYTGEAEMQLSPNPVRT